MIMIIYFVVGHFRGTFSSVNMLKGSMLICWNAEGARAHLSECWRGTCSSLWMLKGYMVREWSGTLAYHH